MNILTFDLEEWLIYEKYPKGGKEYYLPILDSLLGELLGLLDANKITATFFCLGIIAREYPEVVRRIANRGHEIGCHSDKHIRVDRQTPEQFENDLQLALESLESVTTKKIISYRAPEFSIDERDNWVFEIIVRNGLKNDCSVFPASRSGGGYVNFKSLLPAIITTRYGNLLELPVNVFNFSGLRVPFSGGGYFRLLPYSVIKTMTSKSPYVMSYFHLRDFDSKQKEVISWRYIKSYYGIKSMLPKFKSFLRDYKFISVNMASDLLQNEQLNKIVI